MMDAVIRARLGSEVVLVNQVAEYIIGAGGKRLRPALLLLIAGALDYRGPHRLTLAAVVEFIHTATLLHDDVVDESDLRRGRKTANALFGNAAAVLVGDFLYSRSFQMMVDVGSLPVMRALVDDVLDYSGVTAEIGKNVGDDLREGKPTLPLIYLLERGNAAQQNLVRSTVLDSSCADLAGIQAAIDTSGALDYTRAMAEREAAAARVVAERLPESSYKRSLLELCSFAIHREF